MVTIGDVINEIIKIREAANNLEIRGKDNAALICYICSKSDEIITELNKAAEQIQNGSEINNEPEIHIVEAGEENAEFDQ